jgi:hypothetical protein
MPVGSYEVNGERAVPTANSGFLSVSDTGTLRPLDILVKREKIRFFCLI